MLRVLIPLVAVCAMTELDFETTVAAIQRATIEQDRETLSSSREILSEAIEAAAAANQPALRYAHAFKSCASYPTSLPPIRGCPSTFF